ncbi:hypothetical protein BATDEDRAFT_90333 [Batrachochytrium dendrobatidis JAM81]|uniref:Pentacotripeptide-repeat region of PRORP domain-containing protein n=1 Tax=Batrachochytrium dendrobatidis (strain JAM81 / FGSC 10211) TaxID=684364 RepID=F4P7G0_BATDJ|nr:uncharacterized protein BATDEDRAFT_90333 [Batrachochytrium dendrobatidis JAM81]EGF78937.1 hypothetical protein BATDEDRAFT_90333 [Batrachochytrium dendrobatidis JAM81]|eukprot:XP_006680509.1 hypothetical protein BATDEDRAFT_90333 [Batrachochytrium dendrobatidis JAM81]
MNTQSSAKTRHYTETAQQAKRLYDHLKHTSDLRFNISDYYIFISLLIRSNTATPDSIRLILVDMNACGMTPSVEIWMQYLQILAKFHHMDQIKIIINNLISESVIVSESQLEHLLQHLGQTAQSDIILEIIQLLVRARIPISKLSVHSLIHGFGRKKDINNMAYYLHLLNKPSNHNVNSTTEQSDLNDTISDKAMISAAFSTITPDFYIFHSFIRSACAVGNTTMALKAYNQMIQSGIKPNLWTFTFLLRMFAQQGDLVHANSIWERLRFMGVMPDIVLYTMLIKLRADKGDISGMLKLFSEFKSFGLVPDCRLYNALLHGYNLANDLMAMQTLYTHMILEENVIPDETTFTTIMHAHIKAGNLAGARQWFKRMVDAVTVDDLLPATKFNQKQQHASIRTSPISIKPGVISYTVLMSGLAELGNIGQLEKMFLEMVQNNIAPNLYTYTIIIQGYIVSHNMTAALQVFRQMISDPDPIVPDHEVYKTMIGGYVGLGDFDTAWTWISNMEQDGIKPTEKTFALFIDAHIARSDLDSAYNVYEQMLSKNIDPSEHILVALLVHLCRWRHTSNRRISTGPSSPDHHFYRSPDGSIKKHSRQKLAEIEGSVYDPNLSALHNLTLVSWAGKYHLYIMRIYSHYRRIFQTTRKPIKIYDVVIGHLAYFERIPATRDVFMDMLGDEVMPDISIILRMIRMQALDDDWHSVFTWYTSVLKTISRMGNDPVDTDIMSHSDSLETIFEKGLLDIPKTETSLNLSSTLPEALDVPFFLKHTVPFWQELHHREKLESRLTLACLGSYGRYAFITEWESIGKRTGWRRQGIPNRTRQSKKASDESSEINHTSTPRESITSGAGDPIADDRLYWGVDIVKYNERLNRFVLLNGLDTVASSMGYWITVVSIHKRFNVPFGLQPISQQLRSSIVLPILLDKKDKLSSIVSGHNKMGKNEYFPSQKRKTSSSGEQGIGDAWLDVTLDPNAQFSSFVKLFLRHCELCELWEARRRALEWILQNAPLELSADETNELET